MMRDVGDLHWNAVVDLYPDKDLKVSGNLRRLSDRRGVQMRNEVIDVFSPCHVLCSGLGAVGSDAGENQEAMILIKSP